MAEYDRPYPSAPEEAAVRRKWPLATVMAIDFVVALIAFVILTLLVQILFVAVRVAQLGLSPNEVNAALRDQAQAMRLIGADGLFVTLLLTNAAFLLIPVLRVKVIRREKLAEIGFQAQRPLRLVAFGVGLGLLSLLGNLILGNLFRALGIEPDQSANFPLFQGDYTGQILFLIAAAVFAPIGEEVLFRGYMFNAIRQTWKQRPWGMPLAYVASALLFSVIHSIQVSQGLVGLLVPLFLIGLLLAWGMHYSGSLVPCIIAHAMNNGAALLGLLVCINNPGLTGCPKL